MALADSSRATPVTEAVPGADPMATAQVASAGSCPVTDQGSSSRALYAAIGVKRADSEAATLASTCTTRAAPEAAASMSWDGRGVDGRLNSIMWAGSESMVATRSRTAVAMTQMGETREVCRGNPSAQGVLNSDPRWVRSGLIYWVQLVRSGSIG
jgi:hypothetical protein